MLTGLAMFALLLQSAPAALPADEPKKISGRVVDREGCPVPGASISTFWGANGLNWEQYDAIPDGEFEKRMQNEGKMEPWDATRVVTDADGRFSIPAPVRAKSFMAYDRERRHGAIVIFDPKHTEVAVEVRLAPIPFNEA